MTVPFPTCAIPPNNKILFVAVSAGAGFCAKAIAENNNK
jgi:hypothetical protein